MSKVYQLADGSWSSEYKIGDRFVASGGASFSDGSIVELHADDGSINPHFKLLTGERRGMFTFGEDVCRANWMLLKPAPKPFTKSDLKCGMRVTHRDGDEYYVLNGMLVEDGFNRCRLVRFDVFTELDEYDEDLENINDPDYSIVKVTDRDGTVLFEREEAKKEVREMTIGEIQARLGFHVKIVEG